MKNYIPILSLILMLSCCDSPVKKEQLNTSESLKDTIVAVDTTTKKEIQNKEKKSTDVLAGKVFESGLYQHFSDCSFEFACDCCASDLLFLEDSVSYFISHCMSETGLSPGIYSIHGDSMTIITSGITVSEKYNWDAEVDPTAEPYYLADTVTKPHTYRWSMDQCDSKILMKEQHPTEPFYALQTNQNADSLLNEIKEKGLIRRLMEIYKTGANIAQPQAGR